MKKPWVKLVLASSIDGRIAYPEGGKTQLGQSGDRLILEESIAWSDGILMGGQTLIIGGRTYTRGQMLPKRITATIMGGKGMQPQGKGTYFTT